MASERETPSSALALNIALKLTGRGASPSESSGTSTANEWETEPPAGTVTGMLSVFPSCSRESIPETGAEAMLETETAREALSPE